MSVQTNVTSDLGVAAEMAAEGRRIVDEARERGLTLRLLGGLAVRDHCEVLHFCGREHSDLDLVGLRREAPAVTELFAAMGYEERASVRQATLARQAQYVRPCRHATRGGGPPPHADDHVDVFFDVFRMDHAVDLRHRLTLEPYTVSAADLLLTKLQVSRVDARDVHDVVTLLKDVPLADAGAAGAIDVGYIARLCAREWGLHHDVTGTLRRCAADLTRFALDREERERVHLAVSRLLTAIDAAPKPFTWRVRARVGTRVRWHAVVEDQDGRPA